MKPHLQYGSYVARHKWFVLRAGLKTKAPLWRLLIHDWSKLTPAEWFPYVQRDGPTKALPMPEPLVREMVADWMGAGRAITGRWGVAGWYAANAHKIMLADETRELVEGLIAEVA